MTQSFSHTWKMRFVVLTLVLLGSAPWRTASSQPAPTQTARARGDISGDWQGTLQAAKPLRAVFRFARTDKGWTAKLYSLDQNPQPISLSSAAVEGTTVKFGMDMMGMEYTGALSADGNSIVGTYTQNGNPQPLTLVRATKETAWEIPAPPPPPKMMPEDAQPGFDVATIKPNESGATALQGLGFRSRKLTTVNASLGDLISFAFDVQAKQIIGGPDWLQKDRYDIAGTPDVDGNPNVQQMRTMIRKLLEDRFKLTTHHDKRELPAFVLTAAKSGPKLKPTQSTGPGPAIGYRAGKGGVMLIMLNGTVSDFVAFLQTSVVDRPVVNQTGIDGRFDINVTFTPDDSQFGGHAPAAAKPDNGEAAPGLFEAIQQQLGLKLEAQKTSVNVIAIDHVEKPSAN
jgi:uncharacterized protein (TIGR03435 family)